MPANDAEHIPPAKLPAFPVMAMRRLSRLTADKSYRNVMWLRLFGPKQAFQPFNTTSIDRYPRIFAFVQSQLGADNHVRLLSYGCSTGEEATSLRHYFSQAEIKGIDINPANITICRRRLEHHPDASISFEIASSTSAEVADSFDAIFVMAVLRHGDLGRSGVTRCDHRIRFENFALAVEDFRRCPKRGGLLIMQFSNFRLCDAPAGAAFETMLRVNPPSGAKKTPIFGPDNRLMPGIEYPDVVFRKN